MLESRVFESNRLATRAQPEGAKGVEAPPSLTKLKLRKKIKSFNF